MGSKDNYQNEWERLLKSFSNAMNGIMNVIRNERNMQIHLVLSIIVIGLGWLVHLSRVEWMIVIVLIGGMFCLEIVNTAIERTVDLITKEYHPLAKIAKDISAGAVFVFAIISVIIGLLIFLPRFPL